MERRTSQLMRITTLFLAMFLITGVVGHFESDAKALAPGDAQGTPAKRPVQFYVKFEATVKGSGYDGPDPQVTWTVNRSFISGSIPLAVHANLSWPNMSAGETLREARQDHSNTWLALQPPYHVSIHDNYEITMTDPCPEPDGTHNSATTRKTWTADADVRSASTMGVEKTPEGYFAVSLLIAAAFGGAKDGVYTQAVTPHSSKGKDKETENPPLHLPIAALIPNVTGVIVESWLYQPGVPAIGPDGVLTAAWYFDSGDRTPDQPIFPDAPSSKENVKIRFRFAVSAQPIPPERWENFKKRPPCCG